MLGIVIGVGLSAACGFRVFLPFFALALASRAGIVPLAGDFEWLSTLPALIALGTATLVEIVAYYVPWLDHALDVVATPSAILAGAVVTAAVVPDLAPMLRWAIALVAGGGVAGTVQGATVLARAKSGVTTGGIANPVVSTAELAGSATTSALAIWLPIIGFLVVVGMLVGFWFLLRRVLNPGGGEPPAPVQK